MIKTPSQFICPIMGEIMRDPVIASDGVTYERIAIQDQITIGQPGVLDVPVIIDRDNESLKKLIEQHLSEKKTFESNALFRVRSNSQIIEEPTRKPEKPQKPGCFIM